MKKRIVFLCLALLLFSSIAEAMSETDAEKFERLAKEVGLVRFINIKTEEIIAKTYTLPSGKLFLVMAVFGSKGDFRGFTTEFAVDYQPKGEIVKIISEIIEGMWSLSRNDDSVQDLVAHLVVAKKIREGKFVSGNIQVFTQPGKILLRDSCFIDFRPGR